jgi:hypothetical protein
VSTTGQWEALFSGRKWRVAEELTGTVAVPGQQGVSVIFQRGRFEVNAPGAFQSPLSTNLGRRGVVLKETDAEGKTDLPGSRITVGAAALKKAAAEYGAIW